MDDKEKAEAKSNITDVKNVAKQLEEEVDRLDAGAVRRAIKQLNGLADKMEKEIV